MKNELALIICILAGIIFLFCYGSTSVRPLLEKLIRAIEKMSFAAYWVGLLAFLINR